MLSIGQMTGRVREAGSELTSQRNAIASKFLLISLTPNQNFAKFLEFLP
ncbi:hypothetical protein [Coleofasciculus sp. H7-2]